MSPQDNRAHTPPPWQATGHNVIFAGERHVTRMYSEADARLVVTAVNHHAELVEALRDLVRDTEEDWKHEGWSVDDKSGQAPANTLISMCRARELLSRVDGGQK